MNSRDNNPIDDVVSDLDEESLGILLIFEKYEEKKERERNKKRQNFITQRSEEMGISVDEYLRLPLEIRDRRKKPRYTNVRKPIPGIEFSYIDGIFQAFRITGKKYLSVYEILNIGKLYKFWKHKLKKNDLNCIKYALRKLEKQGKMLRIDKIYHKIKN